MEEEKPRKRTVRMRIPVKRKRQDSTGWLDWVCIEVDYHVPAPAAGYSYSDGLVSVQVGG